MISVVVVDDEQLVRSGFAALLASDPEITVVGTAGDGDAALAVIRRERPDVVLMDIRMPGRDGVSATAVITAAQGESVLAPALVRRLIATYVKTPATASKPAWLDSLTPREIEVLVAVGRGLSNAEIGAALYMSAATAKTHVGRLLTKLDARDRTHLVIAAYEAGLMERA
jgi:DNA-binding NarL/FixJ family response regulator